MKKSVISLGILAAALSFSQVQAQIVKQKGITQEELVRQINEIAKEKDTKVRDAALTKEAEAMMASKNEEFAGMASSLFRFIGNADKAEEADKSLIKRFPKGSKARLDAYNAIFKTEGITAVELEKQLTAWEKKFPAKSFKEENRAIYAQGKSRLAGLYFKEKNAAKGNEILQSLKSEAAYAQLASSVASGLVREKDYTNAEPILADIYQASYDAYNSADDKVKSSPTARAYPTIAGNYAPALINGGNAEKGLQVYEGLFKVDPYYSSAPVYVLGYADGIRKTGRDLDAFLFIDNALIQNGKNDGLIKVQKELYEKLNGANANFDNYLASVDKKGEEAMIAKYKGEMIKKEAPLFSLVDRDGKTVSLADYKGKVVVLDFWATWCGPCINSFPGMQASVNKYKDDKDVVFLFIDTWERGDNYKDLVNDFIKKNNYTFHVLFDEMKDREKAAVTAYGVKGIPFKAVIDKEGFIRFESSGSSPEVDKIVKEMTVKIELAKNAK
ncbi:MULTISPECIES: TlpA disulfide reductase family protein [Sphingobacterium]|uniref:TlpA disulfide reductase family protein n=1 Tax=Sphingobacterium tenebrionis TaxID=3111775 RepID=A0ABU8I3I2_9SPHI|nr:TlpA disulfide reductase family protein [Sphingobacterium sp. 1.A.4]